NELDMNAAGGVMSLDPREHVAWSEDAGGTWRYGAENGQYLSYINDDDLGHPATRVPMYGFRTTGGTVFSPQPYYAYNSDCQACTTAYSNARYARRFSELGGFTASGNDVGTLTFINLDSGEQSSCTPAPGYGFRTCTLPNAIDVAVGESYSVSSTGEVELMRMDAGQRALFPSIGTNDDPLGAYQPNPSAGSNAKDVPSLWAGPVSASFPNRDDL
ncbi:MAG TPA: hypothetical protein VHO25_20215, partial [Polyangiaceae bacterium]|nr:hypothetical protein [Polyangiaceae bacterium]